MTAPSAWKLAPTSTTNRPSSSFILASSTVMATPSGGADPVAVHCPAGWRPGARDAGPYAGRHR